MGRSTGKETRLSEQRKYRGWTTQQKIEIVLAGRWRPGVRVKSFGRSFRLDAILGCDHLLGR